MNKTIIGLVIVVVVGVAASGIYFFSMNSDNSSSTANSSQSSTSSADDVATPKNSENTSRRFTEAEVAKHASATDCWTIIDGGVYDLTEYIPRHPGGDEILRACGADGTTLFKTRTTADGEVVGSGGSHSSSAQSQLEQFLIGTLIS